MHTKMFNGWRCSFVRAKDALTTRRRQRLDNLAVLKPVGSMKEGQTYKSITELADKWRWAIALKNAGGKPTRTARRRIVLDVAFVGTLQ